MHPKPYSLHQAQVATVDVVAKDYSELYILSKQDLLDIAAAYSGDLLSPPTPANEDTVPANEDTTSANEEQGDAMGVLHANRAAALRCCTLLSSSSLLSSLELGDTKVYEP